MNVLFVCTGNTCRSPMAEVLLKHYTEEIEVQSAGIFASVGVAMNDYAYQALVAKGIQPNTNGSQPITSELAAWADLILTMTTSHQQTLDNAFPGLIEKTYTLKDYVQSQQNLEKLTNPDIQDPFGTSLAQYRKTLAELEEYISELLNYL